MKPMIIKAVVSMSVCEDKEMAFKPIPFIKSVGG